MVDIHKALGQIDSIYTLVGRPVRAQESKEIKFSK